MHMLAQATRELDPRLVGILIAVVGGAYGLLLIGLGQVFSALREIALNTRAAVTRPVSGSDYIGLRFIAGVLTICGFLIIVASALVGAAALGFLK